MKKVCTVVGALQNVSAVFLDEIAVSPGYDLAALAGPFQKLMKLDRSVRGEVPDLIDDPYPPFYENIIK